MGVLIIVSPFLDFSLNSTDQRHTILSFVNHAHMGSYREAVAAFSSGQDAVPDVAKHEHFGAVKYGFGFNTEQQVTANWRAFARFGWSEGQHESFAYTEVDDSGRGRRLQRVSLGTKDRQGGSGLREQRHKKGSSALLEIWRAGILAG